ncbi:MAG TPA: hypothetical protein DEP36_01595, partial [Gammaproteobacteria bacterium]|nr:hypothetical protein [Gammaproteobacteria bacterium]
GSVVRVKVVKPQKLKVKEMRLELLNALRSSAKDTEREYKKTVATWKHEVKFETIIAIGKTKAEFLVGTDDEIFRYVDEGTKPHIIRPVKAKALRFFSNFSAKTTPGIIGSSQGGSSGDLVFSQGVSHPGTKARNFSKVINSKGKKAFYSKMRAAMKRAAEKSGNPA